MALTMKDDDEREWTAIGFDAHKGEILWIPSDTDILSVSLEDEDNPSELGCGAPVPDGGTCTGTCHDCAASL